MGHVQDAPPKVKTAMTQATLNFLRTAHYLGVVTWDADVDDQWGHKWEVAVRQVPGGAADE